MPQPPDLGPISSIPVDGIIAVDEVIDFMATFTDPDSPSGHSAVWNWGDSSSTSQSSVTSPVEASHIYGESGIYTVTLEVTDPDNLSDTATYQFVVVYDPSGGFVTGGGWIDSPAGAYKADDTLSGKATFGFLSKYNKGKQVPTGNTEFQFKAAGLKFHSDHYYWLVVTGNDTAKFSGSGFLNGLPAPNGEPYSFKIWAYDGEPDTFRMRIWWEDNGGGEHDVYDNGAHQPLGGGAIVVHKGKK